MKIKSPYLFLFSALISLSLFWFLFSPASYSSAEDLFVGPIFIIESQSQFVDIQNSQYKEAITYMSENNIVQGYEGNRFKPDDLVTRAEFVKILIHQKLGSEPQITNKSCFPDIVTVPWWERYVCYAQEKHIVSGYSDGTFRPQAFISFKEAAKIVLNSMLGEQIVEDNDLWHETFLKILDERKAIPPSILGINSNVTRGELAELVWRLSQDKRDQESKSWKSLQPTHAGLPVRLKIPKIQVDASFEYLGVGSDGAMDAPKIPENAGWFDMGPRPGNEGSAVVVGHYGPWRSGAESVFNDLNTLQSGDLVFVIDDLGEEITFVVRSLQIFDPQADASGVFASDDGNAHLNIITCEGIWNADLQSYSGRLVVFAERK